MENHLIEEILSDNQNDLKLLNQQTIKESESFSKDVNQCIHSKFSWAGRTIEKNSGSIRGISYSPCGLYLAALFEETLEILNIFNKKKSTVSNHSRNFNCLSISPNSRFLSIGCKDTSIKVINIQENIEEFSLSGHQQGINCISYCPKGDFLASASSDSSVKIWNINSKKEEYTIQIHSKSVRRVSYSPTGDYLATASLDQSVKIWNLIEKRMEFMLNVYYRLVNSLSFSSNGQFLAVCDKYKDLYIWDLKNRKVKFSYYRHSKEVNCLSFSPHGLLLATGSSDKKVVIFNFATIKEIFCFKGHSRRVVSIAFSSNSKYIASGCADGSIKICNIDKKQEEFFIYGSNQSVICFAVSPDGRETAKVSLDKKARICNFRKKAEKISFKMHLNGLIAIAYSNDGRLLEIESKKEILNIWDVKENIIIFQKKLRTTPKCFFYSTENNYLAIWFSFSTLKLLNSPEMIEELTFNNCPLQVFCFSYSVAGLYTASVNGFTRIFDYNEKVKKLLQKKRNAYFRINRLACTFDGAFVAFGPLCQIWNIQQNKKQVDLPKAMSEIVCLTFSPDSKFLACVCISNIVTVFNILTEKIEFSFDAFSEKVEFIEYSSDGMSLITGSSVDGLKVWSLNEKKEEIVRKLGSDIGKKLIFSANCEFLASFSQENQIIIRNLKDGSKDNTLNLPKNKFKSLALSPCDQLLAGGLEDSGIVLFNLKNKRKEFNFDGKSKGAVSMAFNENGRYLAAGYQNSTIHIWNIHEKKEEFSLNGHLFGVTCLKYSLNSKFLVSAAEDKTVKVWDVEKRIEYFSINPQVKAVKYLSCDSEHLVIVRCKNSIVQVWDYRQKQERNEISELLSPALFTCFSSNGKFIASAHKNNCVKIWSSKSLKEVFRYFPVYCSPLGNGLIHLWFTTDGKYLWSLSKNKICRINFKNKLMSVVDKELDQNIYQGLEIKCLYKKAKILKELLEGGYKNSKSLHKIQKKLSVAFSELIADYIHLKDDSKAKVISKYLLKFSELGFYVKFLSPFAKNLLKKFIKDFNSECIQFGHYNYAIFEYLISSTSGNFRVYLTKCREIFKILYLQRTTFMRLPIITEELSDFNLIYISHHDQYQVHYYSANYFLQNVLVKKYVYNQNITKYTKHLLRIEFEKEASHYDMISKYISDSPNFCRYYGDYQSDDGYFLVFQYLITIFHDLSKRAQVYRMLKNKKNLKSEMIFKFINYENMLESCTPDCLFITNKSQIIIDSLIVHMNSQTEDYYFDNGTGARNDFESKGILILQLGNYAKLDDWIDSDETAKSKKELKNLFKQLKDRTRSSS